eukprot:6192823-Pleurochrysis_carterae.AAC.2
MRALMPSASRPLLLRVSWRACNAFVRKWIIELQSGGPKNLPSNLLELLTENQRHVHLYWIRPQEKLPSTLWNRTVTTLLINFTKQRNYEAQISRSIRTVI